MTSSQIKREKEEEQQQDILTKLNQSQQTSNGAKAVTW